MKISKSLNVPFHAHGKGVIDSNATEWYFQVESIEAAEAICHAVNNHDGLVDLNQKLAESMDLILTPRIASALACEGIDICELLGKCGIDRRL